MFGLIFLHFFSFFFAFFREKEAKDDAFGHRGKPRGGREWFEGRGLGDANGSRGLLEKSPRAPPKLPKQDIATHGRKCEHSASFFYAFKGSFSRTRTAIQTRVPAPLAYRLLRSLALRGVCEWWQERSKAKLTRVGTGVRDGPQNLRRIIPQHCRGELCSPDQVVLTLGSPSGGAPAKRVRGEEKPSPSRYASHLSQGERLILVALDRANIVRHNFSPCGAGFHREAISSTIGGFHPSARESLADRISLRA